MSHQSRVLTEEDVRLLEEKEKTIKGRQEYRRLQSVLYRAKEGKTAKEIAHLLNIHPRTVEKHHQRYFKEGLACFNKKMTGRTGSRLLKPEQEKALFESLKVKATEGQLVNTTDIKACFEQMLGKTCSKGTIYLALHRNSWSKKQPRPRHPKGEEGAKELFKKTPRNSTVNC